MGWWKRGIEKEGTYGFLELDINASHVGGREGGLVVTVGDGEDEGGLGHSVDGEDPLEERLLALAQTTIGPSKE